MGLDVGLDLVPGLVSGGGFNANSVAGLAHWYKADDLATLYQDSGMTTPVVSDGDPVGAWVDQVTGATPLTQSTTAAKPTYRATVAAFSDKQSIQFDGGDFIFGTLAATYSQPVTIFLVTKVDNVGVVVNIQDGTGGADRLRFFSNLTPEWVMRGDTVLSGGTANASVHIFTLVYNTTNSNLYVDGVSAASGDVGTNVTSVLSLGGTTAAGSLQGYIAEHLLYNALLSTDDLNTVQNYLAVKYGISVTEFS